jgi:hypothetical protein
MGVANAKTKRTGRTLTADKNAHLAAEAKFQEKSRGCGANQASL